MLKYSEYGQVTKRILLSACQKGDSYMEITVSNILYFYLIAVNVLAFSVYGMDKRKAKANQWRVPESQLLLLAVIGGSVGALLGMRTFHHKTRKPKFYIGVPVILGLQICLVVFLRGYFLGVL